MNKASNSRIRRLTAISVFCALAYVCVFLIRFKVSFLTFDLKDSVMAIGAMYFGPLAGVAMALIVSFVEFLTISSTGVYGLIMNFLSSMTFCVVASIIYKYKKTLAGAVLSLTAASGALALVMIFANMFITPFYTGFPASQIRAMIPTLFFPFNLVKGVFNSCVVMILYKPFSTALRSAHIIRASESGEKQSLHQPRTRGLVIAVSLAVLILVSLYLFFVLNAKIA